MTLYIFLLSNFTSNLFWASSTLSCFARLAFVIVKLLRLVVSDVKELVRLFRAWDMRAFSTWG